MSLLAGTPFSSAASLACSATSFGVIRGTFRRVPAELQRVPGLLGIPPGLIRVVCGKHKEKNQSCGGPLHQKKHACSSAAARA